MPSELREIGPTFLTTRWTVVLRAADPDSQAAREELARLYWFPLYALGRRQGLNPADADDAVQTFLGRLLAPGQLANLSSEGGRFRDFLRVSFQNQLISTHRASISQRRRPEGGFVPRDGLDPEATLALEPVDAHTPELAYDRCCARVLLDATLERLRAEYERLGRTALFLHLSQYLDGDPEEATHAAAAARLGLSEGTVRNAVKPFRIRFQELFRQHVAATLEDPVQVDDEIRHLMAALAS